MNRLIALLACLGAVGIASTAHAWSPRLEVDEDTWIQLGLLLQLQYEAAEIAGDEWNHEVFTRRARLLGMGSVHERVRFLFTTDVPNAGKAGAANEIIWNDAFIDFRLLPTLHLSIGRLVAPLSPESKASAVSLLAIDYTGSLFRFPTYIDRAFWRDYGLELRGTFLDGVIEYRTTVLRGTRDLVANPDFHPRLGGMVMINFADSQPGWFYTLNSLGGIDVLAIGSGVDYISNSADDVDGALAWSLFGKVEQPVGEGRLNALVAFYDWRGPRPWAADFEGRTVGAQLGYLLPGTLLGGQWQPVVRYQRQVPREADFWTFGDDDLNTFNLGLNYLLEGHSINFKIDWAINERRDGDQTLDTFRFQTQLFF